MTMQPSRTNDQAMTGRTPAATSPFVMKLSLSVLDDLGVNLYSNTAAVLSEAVANAWDADAEEVRITLGDDEIEIVDDGTGIGTVEDINKRYLTVGYKRRLEGRIVTDGKRRHVMGRKGIGKLSLFAIADEVIVDTWSSTSGRLSFAMRTDDIRDAIAADEDYRPEQLDADAASIGPLKSDHGTRLALRRLKKLADGRTASALRQRVARRFSVLGEKDSDEFWVFIDGEAVTFADRGYQQWAEYLWKFTTGSPAYVDAMTTAAGEKIPRTLDGVADAERGWLVSGWIGTVREHRQLDDEQNTLPVLAHGKLVHEDVLPHVKQGGLFTKYVMGEVHADFLDDDELEDIATSDRQHLKEGDERYVALIGVVTRAMRVVGSDWLKRRRKDATDKACRYQSIKDWYTSLGSDSRAAAETLFERIGSLPVDDENDRKELYKHGILAFERLRMRELLSTVEHVPETDFEELLPVFGQLDDIEAAEYAQITKGRIEIIRKLAALVDDDAKERVIQEFLFDHLWLLSPSWERPTANPVMEKRVEKALEVASSKLTEDERLKRLDIAYRTAPKTHIIVELKRYSANFTSSELQAQLKAYKYAVEAVLGEHFPGDDHTVEVVAIVGRRPEDAVGHWDDFSRELQIVNARVITYDELIERALSDYVEYLEADDRVSRIVEILDRLEAEVLDDDGEVDGSTSPAANDRSGHGCFLKQTCNLRASFPRAMSSGRPSARTSVRRASATSATRGSSVMSASARRGPSSHSNATSWP